VQKRYFVFSFTAAGLGLEPRYTGPKPVVLPLDDPAAVNINSTKYLFYTRTNVTCMVPIPVDDPAIFFLFFFLYRAFEYGVIKSILDRIL
jgi:hypothetical protein